MKHILELEKDDLTALFGDGLSLPAGENVVIRAKLGDAPDMEGKLTEAMLNVSRKTIESLREDPLGPILKADAGKRKNTKPTPAAELPYACADCDKRFLLPQGLGAHRRYEHSSTPKKNKSWGHHGENKGVTGYRCSPCGKDFESKFALETHQEDAHGVRKVA